MPLQSMTGFSRVTGHHGDRAFVIEIKSVNGKGLDVRTRIPAGMDRLDQSIKAAAKKKLARGSLNVTITLTDAPEQESFSVNESRLEALLDIAKKYQDRPGVAPARLDGLLSVRGVLELSHEDDSEADIDALEAALIAGFEAALRDLAAAREQEGEHLLADLMTQIAEMRRLRVQAIECAGDRIAAMQARYSDQLDKLIGQSTPVSRERLDAEIALLAVKADIQEELDRLAIHFDEAVRLLQTGEPVGRRLDFLCQEFNREANTLCSKSGNADLTKIGLDLKAVIDQFREQIQNIE